MQPQIEDFRKIFCVRQNMVSETNFPRNGNGTNCKQWVPLQFNYLEVTVVSPSATRTCHLPLWFRTSMESLT